MSKRVKHHLEHLLSHSHEYVVLAAPLVLENSMILFAGGLGLVAGCLTSAAAAGLMVILAGAIYLDVWAADIAGKHPRDVADWIAKTLYCPEVLMFWMLASVILLGPGPMSIDARFL